MPQSRRAYDLFRDGDLAANGLHTVFEDHAAISLVSLAAFIQEYPVTFRIGIDLRGQGGPIPVTMAIRDVRHANTIVTGRDGQIRRHGFGRENDMTLGTILGSLVDKTAPPS